MSRFVNFDSQYVLLKTSLINHVVLFQFTQSYTDKRNRLSSTQGEKPVNLLPSHFFKIDDIPRAEKEFCVHQAEDVSNSIITHKLDTCYRFCQTLITSFPSFH